MSQEDLPVTLNIEQFVAIDFGTMFYGTTLGGDIYFSRKVRRSAWTTASDADKLASLYEATGLIDRLNFKGDKTDDTQKLEFPRGGDTEVPDDIEKATYEVAYQLLNGLDPNLEADLANLSRNKLGSIETEYTNANNQPYVTAGIFSSVAWGLIYPYIRDPSTVNLMRVT